jgi:HEAT repeat protein
MGDPNPRVRAGAVDVLSVAGTTRAASQLLAANEDGDEDVRRAAQSRLVAAHPWLLWMALQQCPRRSEFFAVLREEMSDDALAALVRERISSPEPGDRMLAVELAGWVRTPECLAEAVDALRDPEATVRRAAAAQLRGQPEAVDVLVTTLHDDPDPGVRVQAADALDATDLDTALLAFVGALQDPEVKVRRIAVQALVRNRSSALAHRVGAVLTTGNIRSAGEVLLGMGHFGEEALAAAVAEGPRERAVAAGELLRTRGRPDGLLESLKVIDPATRLRAVEALGAVGGTEVLDGLVGALSDSWPVIRSRAASHLGQMGRGRERQALQRVAQSDPDAEVVEAATQALRTIDERTGGAGAASATPRFSE